MRRSALAVIAVATLAARPVAAAAQGLGIGPRLSFVRGDITTGVPSVTFAGAILRMRSSPHAAVELALDYHSLLSADGTQRVRDLPFQASLLIFPVHGVLSPYLLGGFGVYSEMTDTLDASGTVTDTTTTRRTGWHLGAGAEIFVSRQLSVFGDYRFRFVKLGQAGQSGQAISVPGLAGLHLFHQGSMWTTGIAFYF
jgi:Outer membrane protein beta-barrel domain